jgi:hypothetical protein
MGRFTHAIFVKNGRVMNFRLAKKPTSHKSTDHAGLGMGLRPRQSGGVSNHTAS